MQKTAYEMRISDWSSDVCSSDLRPDGQMGNSEVGHMNLGAGRVVYQDFTRVTKAIRDGEFFENPTICAAVDKAVAAGKAVHFMGLLSDGGVHSHQIGRAHSELQSLMRISYAVFCLKKKKIIRNK